jgi:hypothetical protein
MSPLNRFALPARLAPRALVPVSSLVRPLQAYTATRHFHLSKMASKQIATLDVSKHRLPTEELSPIDSNRHPSSLVFPPPLQPSLRLRRRRTSPLKPLPKKSAATRSPLRLSSTARHKPHPKTSRSSLRSSRSMPGSSRPSLQVYQIVDGQWICHPRSR